MAKKTADGTAGIVQPCETGASALVGADGGGAPPAPPAALPTATPPPTTFPRPVIFTDHDGKQYPATLIAEYEIWITKQERGHYVKVPVIHGTVRYKRPGTRQQVEEVERTGIRRYDRLWGVDQKAYYREV